MLNVIYSHIEEAAAIVLFAIGFTTLLVNKNLIKKIIGFSMMDNAIYLFLASYGYISGRTAPIYVDASTEASLYVNPLPAGLVLTGIVVSVSVTAIMLALTVRLYKRYRTLDIDEIAEFVRKEGA
ncbi:MAG: cation:proton antiporter subunit C [Clostridia bacterium]|nr:cation:proton antiporter subunit C [Clostridia bacterium]